MLEVTRSKGNSKSRCAAERLPLGSYTFNAAIDPMYTTSAHVPELEYPA